MILLIIEDNINIAASFKERLEHYKIEYKIAKTGVEAYKILYETLLSNEFDYIITNIGLPDENGIEIVKFIKSKFNSKIIIYSGKNYDLYKYKFPNDYFYSKKENSPQDIIDMIMNNML